MLQRVPSRWIFPDSTTHGRPDVWAEDNGRLWFWPIPDQTYTLRMRWTGDGTEPLRPPSLNEQLLPAFLALYRAELHRARSAAGLHPLRGTDQ